MLRFRYILITIVAWTCLTTANADFRHEDLFKLSDDESLALITKSDKVDEAVAKGLKWLVSKQEPKTGAFPGKHRNAYTALACIALMSDGHFPGRSPYGDNLEKGIQYLVRQAKLNNGYLGNDGGNMYGHGIATLALTEALGMVKDNKSILEVLKPAMDVILKAQVTDKSKKDHFGGWRYSPKPKDADLSVTVWQILALRSAKNCMLDIPEEAINNALDYVRLCFKEKAKGFCYMPTRPHASKAMKAAGAVCLLSLGADKTEKDQKMIQRSSEFLLNPNWDKEKRHFFYLAYYLATASNMLGGDYRKNTLPKLQNFLISLQNPNGEFRNHHGHADGVYATAMCLICLSVRNQYLPIYQE